MSRKREPMPATQTNAGEPRADAMAGRGLEGDTP
jgi:hypothetical protein